MSAEINVKPDVILKLRDILKNEICEPLNQGAESVLAAEPDAFAWGGSFNAMFGAHAELREVFAQNIKSWSDKTIGEDFRDRLGITAKVWNEAEAKSTPKTG